MAKPTAGDETKLRSDDTLSWAVAAALASELAARERRPKERERAGRDEGGSFIAGLGIAATFRRPSHPRQCLCMRMAARRCMTSWVA